MGEKLTNANLSHAFPVWGETAAAAAAVKTPLGLTVVKITVVVYRREEKRRERNQSHRHYRGT